MARNGSMKALMRMRQLIAATGVTKATVQHYIKEGLIPKPIGTSRNAAFYDESHVNAIRLVKELQSKRFLPLSVIKKVVKRRGGGLSIDEIRTLVEINGKLFPNIQEVPDMKPVSAQELSSRTGVTLKNISLMEKAGMIKATKRGEDRFFAEDDIRIVECFGKLQKAGYTDELGFDASILRTHWDLMKIIVEEEAKILTSRVSGRVPVQNLPAMIEDAATILNTIIGLFHKKIIVGVAKKYAIEFRGKGTV